MRGGTNIRSFFVQKLLGLSPHARGNPGTSYLDAVKAGSIPACAGEPIDDDGISRLSWVYPRMRGGTVWALIATILRVGLSPHARGNRVVKTSHWR